MQWLLASPQSSKIDGRATDSCFNLIGAHLVCFCWNHSCGENGGSHAVIHAASTISTPQWLWAPLWNWGYTGVYSPIVTMIHEALGTLVFKTKIHPAIYIACRVQKTEYNYAFTFRQCFDIPSISYVFTVFGTSDHVFDFNSIVCKNSFGLLQRWL